MRNNLSTVAYQAKPKENVGKITFQEHDNLNVGQTLALLCMGRCLCANYKHKRDNLRMHEKKADNFISTHFVFVDCDGADISATQFCENIKEEYKPSCYYSSYSDDINGTRRFHLLWFFDEPLNYIQAQTTGKFLNSVCVKAAEGKNVAIDTCNNPCQMLFGSFMPNEKGNTNKLYTYNEIISSDEFQEFDMNDVEEKEVKHAQKANKTAKNEGCNSYINYDMCNDYQNKPWNEFAEKWGVDGYERGWVNYRLEHEGWLFSPDSQIPYQYVDEKKYFQMPYIITRAHFADNGSESIKHWLLQTMSLYKLLNPRCDLNRILYRVLQKIELHNLDSNHSLTPRDLIEVMEEVDSYTEEDIEERYKKRLDFLRETSRPKSGIIIKKSKANRDVGYSTLLKQIKTEILCSVVDCSSVSVKEALAIVRKEFPRLDISLNWIQKLYCEMGFAQEKKMTDVGMQQKAILELLEEDKNLSVRKLSVLLKERKGISIGRSTLHRRLKELEI